MELLLTVFLISLLLGSLVLSFSRLDPGASLAEGTDRFETLVRMARAHAAYHGRTVQIQFVPDTSNVFQPSWHRIALAWESDPWNQPGVYQPLLIPGWDLDHINDLVAVEQVRFPTDSPPPIPYSDSTSAADPESDSPAFEMESTDEFLQLQPLTFLPDGSVDSADIRLAPRNEDDPGRMWVYLSGLTGNLTHERFQPEMESTDESAASTQTP